jgi:hypothetical protein
MFERILKSLAFLEAMATIPVEVDCASGPEYLVIPFTDRNCRRGISVAYTRKGVSHREDGRNE